MRIIQKIIEEMRGDYVLKMLDADEWNGNVISPIEESAEKWGVELLAVPPEELAKFQEATNPITEEWIAENEAKGLPVKKVLERYRQLMDEYEATEFKKKYGFK